MPYWLPDLSCAGGCGYASPLYGSSPAFSSAAAHAAQQYGGGAGRSLGMTTRYGGKRDGSEETDGHEHELEHGGAYGAGGMEEDSASPPMDVDDELAEMADALLLLHESG